MHVSAFANSSRSIEAVQIYVDGNLSFKTTNASVEADLSLSQGSHTLLLKLWTATGLNASASVGINVSGTAPAPAPTPPPNPTPPPSGPCAPTGGDPSLTLCSPTNGQTVSSPVHVSAIANSSRPVEASQIYLDDKLVFQGSNAVIEVDLTIPTNGTHGITVKFWTSAGLGGSASVTVNVGAGSSPPPSPPPPPPPSPTPPPNPTPGSCALASADHSVNICSPANGATVSSPIHVVAALNSSDGVDAWHIYLDDTLAQRGSGSSVDASVPASNGSHRITVQFWNPAGSVFHAAVIANVGGSAPPPSPTPPPSTGIPHSSHVVLVIEENRNFSEVFPNGMPWLVGRGNTYGYAANYHANETGSLLDYLWLSSGSGEQSFGCNGDNCGGSNPATGNPITDNNIFRRLIAAGLSWKVYAESLPSGVDPTTIYQSGNYVARHNPAVFYSDILNSSAQKQHIVPFSQFAQDLASDQLPAYSLIIPDVTHDAQNGSLGQADSWLANNVAPLLNHPSFQSGGDGLLIVTFDECNNANTNCDQQVYTAVIGPNVKPGTKSTVSYRHENVLRTILDALGVTSYPGAASGAASMTDFF